MNDKTKTNATGLFRVNYSWIANNGAIRNGAFVVEAKDTQEAWTKGEEKLPTFGLRHPKVTGTKPY